MGNLELDFHDGEIRYKVHVACEDVMPTAAMIKWSIYCLGSMFKRYDSRIVDIIFYNISAKNAIEKCENDTDGSDHTVTESSST